MMVYDDPSFAQLQESNMVAVPISEEETRANVRVCVIVRQTADPASGHFVVLETFPGGRVLLGCLTDAANRVTEWLELWVQDFEDADADGATAEDSNAARDERWQQLAESMRALDPSSYFALRSATAPAKPVWVDLASRQPFHPKIDQAPLDVCLEDSRLLTAGLPAYGVDHRRFGWVPQAGTQGQLVALTASITESDTTIPLSQFLPASPSGFAPLNPAGGRMLARRFAPLGLTEFAAILAGRQWQGLVNARRPFRLGGVYRSLEQADALRSGGLHFFSAREGQAGRAIEALHLKLTLLEQCVRLVHDELKRSQLPLLNLSAESFRVHLGAVGPNLPYCWTGRPVLARFGQAVVLPVPNSRNHYFRARGILGGSIYRPEDLAIPRNGNCRFRIVKLQDPTQDGRVVEATLVTQQRVEPNELLKTSIPYVGGSIPLFGTVNAASVRTQGEYSFRSIPLHFTKEQAAALPTLVGTDFSYAPLEVLPPLNSPCDLFALGVLALEILFAGSEVSLPTALDAFFSLMRELAHLADPEKRLAESIQSIFQTDPRFFQILGSAHICQHPQTTKAEAAAALVPTDLWFAVLAVVVRFFPGRGPFSYRRDFGDATALAVHSIFEQPLFDLSVLCSHTRSLHVMDWAQNLELAEAIASFNH